MRIYANPLWIIATGESRFEVPVGELKEEGHIVMGINRVINETPLNFWHGQDVWAFISDFQSIRGTGIVALIPDDAGALLGTVFKYRREMIPALGSGMTGLFLGASLGFNPIFLVGFDFHQGGSPRYEGQIHEGVVKFKEKFPDVDVYNTSKTSKMKQFPYRSFDDCRHGEC